MATLGNQTLGFTYSISGTYGDIAGGPYTVPSPGILVTGINVYYGNNGNSENGRLYIWKDSGGHPGPYIIRDANQLVPLNGIGWQYQGGPWQTAGGVTSDLYLPAGWVIWIGGIATNGVLNCQGAGSGTTALGTTSDGDFAYSSNAGGGMGVLGAYINYNPLPAPTLSSASPAVGAPGTSVVLTGTSLLHTSGITCCGVTVTSYTINSDTQITMTVPAGASGVGTIVVTNPAGSASTAFTAGTIYATAAATDLKAVWVGVNGGVTTVHGVWVPNGAGGTKRIW